MTARKVPDLRLIASRHLKPLINECVVMMKALKRRKLKVEIFITIMIQVNYEGKIYIINTSAEREENH